MPRPAASEAFWRAVQKGRVEVVKEFLDAGERADQTKQYFNDDGTFCHVPLISLAVQARRPGVLKLLLEAGAAYEDKSWIDDVDSDNCTAVCWAFAFGYRHSGKPEQVEMAKLLIEAGADIKPSGSILSDSDA